jgi:hypothetical protein
MRRCWPFSEFGDILASDAIKFKVRKDQEQEKLDVIVQIATSEYLTWQVDEVI